MAGQTVNSVTSAVTAELTSRVFSVMIQRYGKDAATKEKLQRLEMLLIKIHSAIEASEMRTIENSWLLQWREKLKEAVSQGDEVLASFRNQVKDAQDTRSAHSNQKQGEAASSSSAAAPIGALSSTRNSLSGMVQGICNARKMLFSNGGDDLETLNMTLGMLEVLSSDIGEFIRLLHFEALPKVVDETAEEENMEFANALCGASPLQCDSADLPKEPHSMILQNRPEAAFSEIWKAVQLADSHDLENLEWLACWTEILREAMAQGWDFLATTNTCRTISMEGKEEPALECDQEEDELSNLVHRLDGLARDVVYFSKLVDLSPETIFECRGSPQHEAQKTPLK